MAPYDFTGEAKATDEELAGALSKLGPVPDEKLAELLPERADQEQLKALIDAVNAAATENDKKTALLKQLGTVSKAVKDAAAKLAKLAL